MKKQTVYSVFGHLGMDLTSSASKRVLTLAQWVAWCKAGNYSQAEFDDLAYMHNQFEVAVIHYRIGNKPPVMQVHKDFCRTVTERTDSGTPV